MRVEGPGFRVQGSGFRVQGSGLRPWGGGAAGRPAHDTLIFQHHNLCHLRALGPITCIISTALCLRLFRLTGGRGRSVRERRERDKRLQAPFPPRRPTHQAMLGCVVKSAHRRGARGREEDLQRLGLIHIHIYLSIYLSIYPSIHLSIYLSMYLYLSIYLSIHPSIFLSTYLYMF